jgi:hypothetical protein
LTFNYKQHLDNYSKTSLVVLAEPSGYKATGRTFKPDLGASVLSLRDSDHNRMILCALNKAEHPENVTRIVLVTAFSGRIDYGFDSSSYPFWQIQNILAYTENPTNCYN